MASAPDECLFNHEIVMDIMHIDANPVLQIVCIGTRLTVAAFISDKSAETTWSTFYRIWTQLYVGSLHIMRVDQGSEFVGETLGQIVRVLEFTWMKCR